MYFCVICVPTLSKKNIEERIPIGRNHYPLAFCRQPCCDSSSGSNASMGKRLFGQGRKSKHRECECPLLVFLPILVGSGIVAKRTHKNYTSIDPKQFQNDSLGPIFVKNDFLVRPTFPPRAESFINDSCRHRHC